MSLINLKQLMACGKKNNHFYQEESGQALLTFLIFIIIALTLTASSVAILISNSQNTTSVQQSVYAEKGAESGIENALLQLLRNPAYSGEVITIDNGTVTITVTDSDPHIVTSVGKSGDYIKTIRATIGYTDNILSIISWSEIH